MVGTEIEMKLSQWILNKENRFEIGASFHWRFKVLKDIIRNVTCQREKGRATTRC